MKKFKNLFFLFIFIIVSPIFAVACNKTTFDDVPYASTSKTAAEVISQIDDTRSLMINSIELKVSLTTTNVYTFKNMENYNKEDKVVKDVIKTTIGNSVDDPDPNIEKTRVAIVETTRYINNKRANYEKKIYVHTVLETSAENSYVYTKTQQFDLSSANNSVISTNYDRSKYTQANVGFLMLYNNAVPTIADIQVDSVLHKQFEDVDYYKLTSDINGLYYINESFLERETLYENPTLFGLIDKGQDYVMPFTCEFGLKSTEGYNYITYSTLNYDVENEFREVYLSVSSRTELDQYGDKVSGSWPANEDKDKYTAHTFVNLANQSEFYISYKVGADAANYNNVSVAKFVDTLSSGEEVTSYSVEVTPVSNSITGSKAYYYLQGNTGDASFNTYLLTLGENKTFKVDRNFNLELLNFVFDNLAYFGKVNEGHRFVEATTSSSNEYTEVTLTNGEVSKISCKKAGETTTIDLSVLEYGSEPEVLGLTQSLEGFTELS